MAIHRAAAAARQESLLAALPFLIVSLSGAITLMQGLGWLNPDTLLGKAVTTNLAIISAITFIGLLIYAWRKGFPLWSASWSVFWLAGAFMLLIGVTESLFELGEFYYEFLQPLVLALIAIAIAYILYRLFRQEVRRGMLAALPALGIPWMVFNEFVPDTLEGSITLLAWLILAGAAIALLRSSRLSLSMGITLAAVAPFGLLYAYQGVYHGGALNFDAPGPSPLQVMRVFTPYLVTLSTVVIGPLFARRFFWLGVRSGEAGRRIYRLPLLGLLLMILASLLTLAVITSNGLRVTLPGYRLTLNLLNWLGAVLFTAGFIGLMRTARRNAAGFNPGIMALFYVLALLLPGMLMLGLRYGYSFPDRLKFYDVAYVFTAPEPALYIFGTAWMLISAWLAVRLNQESSQP